MATYDILITPTANWSTAQVHPGPTAISHSKTTELRRWPLRAQSTTPARGPGCRRHRQGRLPRLHRHPEPRHPAADGRRALRLQDHPGHHPEIMGEAWTPAPVAGRNTDPMAEALFVLDIGDEWTPAHPHLEPRFRDWLEAMADQASRPTSVPSWAAARCARWPKAWRWGRPAMTNWRPCAG